MKPRFKVGDLVVYEGKNARIVSSFLGEAPGSPEDEHNRYYVEHLSSKGALWSVKESSLNSAE